MITFINSHQSIEVSGDVLIQNKAKVHNLFLQKIPTKILIELRRSKESTYTSQISKMVDCTYSHTVKVLDEMHSLGLIEYKRQGRLKLVKLTDKGADLSQKLDRLINTFNKVKNLDENEE